MQQCYHTDYHLTDSFKKLISYFSLTISLLCQHLLSKDGVNIAKVNHCLRFCLVAMLHIAVPSCQSSCDTITIATGRSGKAFYSIFLPPRRQRWWYSIRFYTSLKQYKSLMNFSGVKMHLIGFCVDLISRTNVELFKPKRCQVSRKSIISDQKVFC